MVTELLLLALHLVLCVPNLGWPWPCESSQPRRPAAVLGGRAGHATPLKAVGLINVRACSSGSAERTRSGAGHKCGPPDATRRCPSGRGERREEDRAGSGRARRAGAAATERQQSPLKSSLRCSFLGPEKSRNKQPTNEGERRGGIGRGEGERESERRRCRW